MWSSHKRLLFAAALQATLCTSCPANSKPRLDIESCECDAAFFRQYYTNTSHDKNVSVSQDSQVWLDNMDTSNSSCEFCPDGTFKNVPGDQLCTPVPDNANMYLTRTGFSCAPGASPNSDATACPTCATGTFKNVSGNHPCTECPFGMAASTAHGAHCDVCTVGFFSNTDLAARPQGTTPASRNNLECEACPLNTYNPVVGSVGYESCLDCPYNKFQPTTGKGVCVYQHVKLSSQFHANSRVVGLFTENDTSCAYVSNMKTRTTDKVCWGELTEAHPAFTLGTHPVLLRTCGDGALHPVLESCDDGNFFSGDGCSVDCEIEPGFFCQERAMQPDIGDMLWTPSVCCRVLDSPPTNTPTCARCDGRTPPYPGVRFRAHDCMLVDIDERAERTDACVLQPGDVSCVNLDAVASSGITRFECVCAPGLFPSSTGCIAERFVTQFLVFLDPRTLSAEVSTPEPQSIPVSSIESHFKLVQKLFSTSVRHQAGVIVGPTRVLDVRVERVDDETDRVRCMIFSDSLEAMQDLTALFNTTLLDGKNIPDID